MEFNNRSRKLNALLASSSGVIQQVVQIVGNLAYRTIFLMMLSKEYLGINGLFSNILQLFSLTELGIGSAILYSMYKPFAQRDTRKIGALVQFYKKVYQIIALVVLGLGLCFYPFIETLVDVSEVPGDVNLNVVYFLFVLESVTGYLFAYKHSLLTADQKPYMVTAFTCVLLISGYVVRAAVLLISKNFELVLLSGITSDLILNCLFSFWITRKYSDLFKEKGELPKEEISCIYKNTASLLCHKIGSIVVTSTDNIILSKYVSLAAVGIYSNYATIVLAITNVASRIFSGILPIITNYTITRPKDETYTLFNRLLFANLWMASFTTVCLYVLLTPFIELWLDETYLLQESVVAMICLQHYLQVSRLTANNFVNSCGLFMRDKVRPLFESAINLVASIVLVKKIGITGVFVGTCVSGVLTYYWREPYLVFKNFFGKGIGKYWMTQAGWFALTAAMCGAGTWICDLLPATIFGFAGKMLIAGLGSNVIILVLTFRRTEFRYFLESLLKRVR